MPIGGLATGCSCSTSTGSSWSPTPALGIPCPPGSRQTWLAEATTLEQRPIDWRQAQGGARHLDPDGTIHLLWFEALASDRPLAGRWLLGVSRDQKLLHDFMGEAQLQLDAVLVLTYVLIAVIGYFIVRGLGRAYERTLEVQVEERTEALRIAHSEMLAKTRLATIGQTAAMLAHEMRNPLASIKLALSALAGSPTLGDREGRRVDLVLGEVDRLNALLSETLDYVRPIDLSADPIALDRLIDETLQLEEPSLAEKALNLSRVRCESCAPIRLDGAQMRQVLLNLLRNAIEASPVGGTIRIATRCEGDDLVLEIVNPAEAIDDQALGRAFEPFYSTKARGTGLGLGLVKRVVEEHGGRIRLDADGQEVQVEIRLPLRGP